MLGGEGSDLTEPESDPWLAPALSARQEQHRQVLTKAIRLAQDFEATYRPRRVERPGDRELLSYVAYAHLVRIIELCRGVLDLRESPVQNVLMRVLCETFINLQFIECEPEKRIDRAKNFHDFSDVNRWRLLLEIGRRFPHILRQAGRTDAELKTELDVHRDRFSHKRSDGSDYWDWERLDLVARVEAYAKVTREQEADPTRPLRIVALYQETNPYVHSGMRSLMDSLIAADGDEVIHPRLMSKEQEINSSLLAAALIADLLATCTRILDCSDFDERIEAMRKEVQAQ